MLDIVRGVHFLHGNRVVHRDIKSKVGGQMLCLGMCALPS